MLQVQCELWHHLAMQVSFMLLFRMCQMGRPYTIVNVFVHFKFVSFTSVSFLFSLFLPQYCCVGIYSPVPYVYRVEKQIKSYV